MLFDFKRMHPKIKKYFAFFLLFYISILITNQYKSLLSNSVGNIQIPGFNKNNDRLRVTLKNIPTFNRFISADYKDCGGLGNQVI